MAALEQHLKNQSRILPEHNLVPTSLYRLISAIDLDLSMFEKHVCINDCELFADLDHSEFAQHAVDACSKCGELRFDRRGRAVSPRKKFYHIPLALQLGQLLEQPEVKRSLQKMATEIRAGVTCLSSFWGGKLAEPLVKRDGFLDHFQRNLALSIGLDGVQAFKKEEYEVWPIGVKIWNLHPEERTSKGKVLLTSVVPGPKCPKSFEPYLQPLLQEIKTSTSEGLTLPFFFIFKPVVLFSSDACHFDLEGLCLHHRNGDAKDKVELHLLTVEEDQAALPKVSEHFGAAARENCWKCRHKSVPNVSTGGGAYQTGYLTGAAFSAQKKTNETSRQFSQGVLHQNYDPSDYGIREPSIFTRLFPDFNVVHGHPIEFFHKMDIVSLPCSFFLSIPFFILVLRGGCVC